jgi:hypothetical protein
MTPNLIVCLEPAAISLHRDDGSSPRLIAAFIPDVIDERIDEQGENIHLIDPQRAQNPGIDSELTSSTRGNANSRFFCPE